MTNGPLRGVLVILVQVNILLIFAALLFYFKGSPLNSTGPVPITPSLRQATTPIWNGEEAESSTLRGTPTALLNNTTQVGVRLPNGTAALLKNTTQVGGRLPNVCEVPSAGFRAWEQGVVTVLDPIIPRNCTKIFQRDQEEIKEVRDLNRGWESRFTSSRLLDLTSSCEWVMDYFSDNLYVTKLERSFPIAYSFVIYNSPLQFLRLFKFLYRPMNTYCLHPDKKSSPEFSGIIDNIARCLNNTFVAARLIDVGWGKPTLMEAQMSCMSDLVDMGSRQSEQTKWKYVVNLCGKELPLVTTHDMILHLTKVNGSSIVTNARKIESTEKKTTVRLRGKKVPFNLQLYKGLAYMALSYEFAHFLLTNETAISLYKFFKQSVEIPEEHFYSTLYMVPGVPGGFNPSIPKSNYFKIISVFWTTSRLYAKMCTGKVVHQICIITSGNLEDVIEKITDENGYAPFHNKYFMELDNTVMDCMEEKLVAENRREFKADCLIN